MAQNQKPATLGVISFGLAVGVTWALVLASGIIDPIGRPSEVSG